MTEPNNDRPVRDGDAELRRLAAGQPLGELAYLGVSCDQLPFCDQTITGDFKVRTADDKTTRLGYVLDHAARHGWRVEGRENPLTAKTFCPDHAARAHCPDGGTCHHRCADEPCFRVQHCGPLSGVFPGDRWPDGAT